MKDLCVSELGYWAQWSALVVVLLVERFFGKTKLFPAGSILEAREMMFKRRKKPPEETKDV